jgi:hypothetical protein
MHRHFFLSKIGGRRGLSKQEKSFLYNESTKNMIKGVPTTTIGETFHGKWIIYV